MTNSPIEEPLSIELAEETAMVAAGSELRGARIKAGLSEEDVGKRLRLDAETIIYLEKEDYERLPAPAFVRGYLRNYAALLGLPSDPLVEAFNRRGLPAPPLKPDITQGQTVTPSRFPLRIATYGVLLCAVILIGAHLYGQSTKAHRTDAAASTDEEKGSPSDAASSSTGNSLPPKQSSSTTSVPDVAKASPAHRPTAVSHPLSHDANAPGQTETMDARRPPGSERPRVDGKLNSLSPQLSKTGSTSQAPTPPNPAPARNEPTAVAPPAVVEKQPSTHVQTAAEDRLAMRFAHDSWVEIYDSRGTRLYYSLVKEGKALALTGAAPFRVLLGYAKDVEIEYNGLPFDHSSFIQPRGMARFSLGPKEGTPPSGQGAITALEPTSSNSNSPVPPAALTEPAPD